MTVARERVLIVYASRFGATKGIAERIGDVLRADGLDATIQAAGSTSAGDGYDAYVIGSAVNAGHWLKEASGFVRRHRSTLASHPVWLFSSGPIGDLGVGSEQPDPVEVKDFQRQIRPRDHRVFAGAFDRETVDPKDLGFLERTVVMRFLPEGDWRDWEAIESWAHAIGRGLMPVPAGGR
jgi:menaquinone-dependent protoporphyrinogen oxidase